MRDSPRRPVPREREPHGGWLVLPVGGYHHASKYAIEAISDALSFGASPFGITVSVVEPGLIRTGFEEVANRTLSASDAPHGRYGGLAAAAKEQTGRSTPRTDYFVVFRRTR